MKKRLSGAETPLEKRVQRELNSRASEYDEGAKAVLADLFHGGCESGYIGSLVYYTDTVRFYARHRTEINTLLASQMEDMGVYSPTELFGEKWDKEDPLALDRFNQNLLAWFAFEETARTLAGRNEIEC